MGADRRWTVCDRYGNEVYLSQERWEHITDPSNHPEMRDYEAELRATIQSGKRQQDVLNLISTVIQWHLMR